MIRGERLTRFFTTACVALFWSLPGQAQSSDPYFASISIERAIPGQSVPKNLARLVLHVRDPDHVTTRLLDVDGVDVIAFDADTVSVLFVEKPTVGGHPDEKFRRNSFVIDFDEAPVLSLGNDLRSSLPHNPTAENLVDFVHEHIEDKNYSRGFDLASRVAESREGDCTEHAVLLAALARSSGHYARVVFGTLIVDTVLESFAYGHAWTEIYDGTAWQIKDATMPESEPSILGVRYLPLAVLDNEGPGYNIAMFHAINSMPAKITGFANQGFIAHSRPHLSPMDDTSK